MRNVVLSADGERMVYAVPDEVAENLAEYCAEFCDWLWKSPDAQKYRRGRGVCYTEEDFIEYLNTWRFPREPARLVKNLGWIDFDRPLPGQYAACPAFNF